MAFCKVRQTQLAICVEAIYGLNEELDTFYVDQHVLYGHPRLF